MKLPGFLERTVSPALGISLARTWVLPEDGFFGTRRGQMCTKSLRSDATSCASSCALAGRYPTSSTASECDVTRVMYDSIADTDLSRERNVRELKQHAARTAVELRRTHEDATRAAAELFELAFGTHR